MKKPRNNTIEINGKLYDARSGQPIKKPTVQSPVKSTTGGKYVDGVRKPAARTAASKPTSKKAAETAKPKSTRQTTRAAAPKAATKPRRSSTLHRRSVKRPKLEVAIQKHVGELAEEVPDTRAGIIPKTDKTRVKRAQKIPRSTVIGRFYPNAATTKEAEASQHPLTQHVKKTHTKNVQPKQQRPTTKQPTKNHTHAAAERIVKAHTKTHAKRRRLSGYVTTAAVVLLLGGYVAYLNIPDISMRVAANRAGFAASMPHTPSGYRLSGPIAYSPGQVVVNFNSNTDDRRFSVKQQPTSWDSLALLENYVAQQSDTHATYQDRGLTIYVYDGGNAAWVSDGKMYTVEGKNAQLAINQILDIAASM